jgi:hypothetical protein
MTSHEYAQKWYRHDDGDNPAIEYYQHDSIAELQEILATLTQEDINALAEWGITDITGIDEWRDAIRAALEDKRAAQGGTP